MALVRGVAGRSPHGTQYGVTGVDSVDASRYDIEHVTPSFHPLVTEKIIVSGCYYMWGKPDDMDRYTRYVPL